MTMNAETRLKAFMKMGFHEVDIKNISVSCGQCRESKRAANCKIVESEVKGARVYKERLVLLCPDCNEIIIGADV